ncbi:LLM class flavin-dependent oxidoreductase [Tianweitania sediminis]|uniref:LLM class flavin-dependent oxidoreductase n=1 Tax=Tianweitania sediminis TaxID=1502156 RepID=A0A8J7R547_9HYPH|nr:LLM class flavin-dependent oxidoreductase [Tianweitania sediminis]MBP0441433.1 LLM class flavin-dependent oxidoreductase [Tianweitania sediminis]
MHFGVLDHLDFGGKTDLSAHYEERLRMVERLDRAGFYGFHVTEHHCTPLGGAASPSIFLASAAQRTDNIRLGTLVYTLPMHHPLRLIEEICMLDHLSNGRLDIGFGRGSVPFELSYFGLDPDDAVDHYSEALKIVREGLTTSHLDHNGKYFQFRDIPIALFPLQRPMPPVWYGVHSIESAQKSADLGYNIVCNQAVENSARYIGSFREALDKSGTSRSTRMIGLHRAVIVAPTDREAEAVADRAYQNFLKSFRFVTARHGAENKVSGRENSFAELVKIGRGIAGSPATVADFLADQMSRAGANYCLMYLALGDMSHEEITTSIKLLANQVMPRLQGEDGLARYGTDG